MGGKILTHLRHHARFYAAALLGVACFELAPGTVPERLLAAGDLSFLAYLIAMAVIAVELKPHHLRLRAKDEDEGIGVILFVVLLAISFCLSAVFAVLSVKKGLGPLDLTLTIAAVPLGWSALHTVAAFHYANLFYAPDPSAGDGSETQPLIFPGTDCPGPWDFIYFAFVIGMTFQVSDVQIAASQLRRAALGHSIVSFFFNTAIVAMAVNAAVNLTS